MSLSALCLAVLVAGVPTLSGCGGESVKTGTVAKPDPDESVRNKSMEDFMSKQSQKK